MWWSTGEAGSTLRRLPGYQTPVVVTLAVQVAQLNALDQARKAIFQGGSFDADDILPALEPLEQAVVLDIVRHSNAPRDDIRVLYSKLFSRLPSEREIAMFREMQPYVEDVATDFRAKTIADAYRYRHGSTFALAWANEISRALFLRDLRDGEAVAISRLVKRPAPTRLEPAYVWVLEQVRRILKQSTKYGREDWKLVLSDYIMRPPFDFEAVLWDMLGN